MGQRHQTFIVVNRPTDIHENYVKDFNSTFGEGKYFVLPYHHQWLYGVTAIENCFNVLKTSEDINWDLFHQYIFKLLDDLPTLFKNIQSLTKRGGKFSLEGFSYLGKDEPIMRDKFDMGDNNDGITIIYPQENKYCFMFVNSLYDLDEGEVAPKFPRTPYVPFTAMEYAQCYYPIADDETIIENKETFEQMESYKLLTKTELKKIFPKMKKELV